MSLDEVSRRRFLAQLTAVSQVGNLPANEALKPSAQIASPLLDLRIVGTKDCLWSYAIKNSGREHRFTPPAFNIDGKLILATLIGIKQIGNLAKLRNDTTEHVYRGTFAEHPDLSLVMQFRIAEDNPIIRFRYTLESSGQHSLTKPSGRDELNYLSLPVDSLPQLAEIRLSNFIEQWHSYSLEKIPIDKGGPREEVSLMGPILVASDSSYSMLVAYEHGSQHPDAFLQFRVGPDQVLSLDAVKGNYLTGQTVDPDHRFETIWFETGAVIGDESALASAFRTFVLKRMTLNLETRKPQIFYNTWNFQERNKWWNGKPFSDSMNTGRILSEIEVARRLGVEVYVLDAGWYGLTGDWNVNLDRFPGGLKEIKDRLEGYGMKFGLWFGATIADTRSETARKYQDCVMSWKGEERKPSPGFTSDVNDAMCLVSRYGDAFLEQLIRLHRETGVTYFKWDGVEQNVCDSDHHEHGTSANTGQERADTHTFQLVRQMCRIADKLADACPDAIIDFDITERYRAVGLSFLSSGRFFHINNGPYYHSYDVPNHKENANWNILFYPGPARTWLCRSPLKFNEWIPSTLLLTHYFPDDPITSQEVNMASMILGQNGIWGDLLGISEAGVQFIAAILSQYKKVRKDMAESDPVVTGSVSGSPEIYEHISAQSGKGAVVIFANAPGNYSYRTKNRVVAASSIPGGSQIKLSAGGRARISCTFDKPGARVMFFGGD